MIVQQGQYHAAVQSLGDPGTGVGAAGVLVVAGRISTVCGDVVCEKLGYAICVHPCDIRVYYRLHQNTGGKLLTGL